MPLTLTAAQRDAIYGQLLSYLTGVADVPIAIRRSDYATADQLARDYADALLLLPGLGWGETSQGPVELTLPADALRRALVNLREHAAAQAFAQEELLLGEDLALLERARLAEEACDDLLADLGGSPQ